MTAPQFEADLAAARAFVARCPNACVEKGWKAIRRLVLPGAKKHNCQLDLAEQIDAEWRTR